jgi:choloylglycine hydrolase
MKKIVKFLILFSIPLLLAGKIEPCTGIAHRAEDGSWVYARTLEFGTDLISFDLLFVPRNITFIGQAKGSEWVNRYAFIGFNPFGLPLVADGMNEKGLACGAFYFPGYAQYQKTEDSSKAISNLDVTTWILGNFSSVSAVKKALQEVKVVGILFAPWGMIPPLHYFVIDQTGDKAVIEYVGGSLKIYDVTLETITNAPAYDWHLLNARNYIGLRALNSPSIKINGMDLSQFGQGSGALGLPGDFTPPSRLIRACFFNQVVLPAKKAVDNVKRAFKILNQFDIPEGAVREKKEGKELYEATQWTSAADLSGLIYYFHTLENRSIHSVHLKKLNLNAKKPQAIPITDPEIFIDLTPQFKKL